MTYEEAIAWLKFRKDYAGELNHEYDDRVTALACEALEKQIPKKPIMDNDNGIYEEECCPLCKRVLFPNDHHCPCGQAIDWSDSE